MPEQDHPHALNHPALPAGDVTSKCASYTELLASQHVHAQHSQHPDASSCMHSSPQTQMRPQPLFMPRSDDQVLQPLASVQPMPGVLHIYINHFQLDSAYRPGPGTLRFQHHYAAPQPLSDLRLKYLALSWQQRSLHKWPHGHFQPTGPRALGSQPAAAMVNLHLLHAQHGWQPCWVPALAPQAPSSSSMIGLPYLAANSCHESVWTCRFRNAESQPHMAASEALSLRTELAQQPLQWQPGYLF